MKQAYTCPWLHAIAKVTACTLNWIPVHVVIPSKPTWVHIQKHVLQWHVLHCNTWLEAPFAHPYCPRPQMCSRTNAIGHASTLTCEFLQPNPNMHPWNSCLYHEDMWGPWPPAFQHMVKDSRGVNQSHGSEEGQRKWFCKDSVKSIRSDFHRFSYLFSFYHCRHL